MASMSVTVCPLREDCTYTKCYCEENVWKLCQHIQETTPDELDNCFVVFISNSQKTIPLWQQMASSSPEMPVVWDYHVILLHQKEQSTVVYDLDTRLSFPCSFNIYFSKGIRLDQMMKPDYHRVYRVIPSETYLRTFASDRSHMLKEDQSWMSPPPTYPCIKTEESANNIDDFISMELNRGVGTVMGQHPFVERFGSMEYLLFNTN